MKEIDRKIQEALRDEDAEFLAEFNKEPSMFEMLIETVQGKHRWLNMLVVFWSLVFFVLGVIAVVNFFQAEETRDMLIWAAASIFCLSAVSMMKVFYWMELNKNAITREVKRLELQIARLTGRLGDS